MIYLHSNLNALIKKAIGREDGHLENNIYNINFFIELNKGHREVIESNINKS